MARRERIVPATSGGGLALGDLLKAKGIAVSATDAPPTPTPAGADATRAATASSPAPAAGPRPQPGDLDLGRCGKIVVRRERKGRGGKTATIISGVSLPPAALDTLCRTMRKALGCGGGLEDSIVVLHGDLVDRARAWLASHGATRIVIGN